MKLFLTLGLASLAAFQLSTASYASRAHSFSDLSISDIKILEAITLKTDQGKALTLSAANAKAILKVTPIDTDSGRGLIKLDLAGGDSISINLAPKNGIGIDAGNTPQIADQEIQAADSGIGIAAQIAQVSYQTTAENQYEVNNECSASVPQQVCTIIEYPNAQFGCGQELCTTQYQTVIGNEIDTRATADYNQIERLTLKDASGAASAQIDFLIAGHRSDYPVASGSCSADSAPPLPTQVISCGTNLGPDACMALPPTVCDPRDPRCHC